MTRHPDGQASHAPNKAFGATFRFLHWLFVLVGPTTPSPPSSLLLPHPPQPSSLLPPTPLASPPSPSHPLSLPLTHSPPHPHSHPHRNPLTPSSPSPLLPLSSLTLLSPHPLLSSPPHSLIPSLLSPLIPSLPHPSLTPLTHLPRSRAALSSHRPSCCGVSNDTMNRVFRYGAWVARCSPSWGVRVPAATIIYNSNSLAIKRKFSPWGNLPLLCAEPCNGLCNTMSDAVASRRICCMESDCNGPAGAIANDLAEGEDKKPHHSPPSPPYPRPRRPPHCNERLPGPPTSRHFPPAPTHPPPYLPHAPRRPQYFHTHTFQSPLHTSHLHISQTTHLHISPTTPTPPQPHPNIHTSTTPPPPPHTHPNTHTSNLPPTTPTQTSPPHPTPGERGRRFT
ncbi:hypothetical protein C7M84_009645 [Penaeus vannamei]|uniref:Uncharacterized protein n=1 Tax=Penaeus vannamei TaxID=6689 RepID=A0A423T6K5_PENVA|nr:hypothetical protein C7M84_009645 [Penaeus vannamei]